MEDKDSIIAFLNKTRFTLGLSEAEINILWKCLEIRHFAPEDIILKERESSDDIYVILHGSVKILVNDGVSNKQFRIIELGEEERFGEISFRDGLPRSSTVKAITNTTVIMVSKQKLLNYSVPGKYIIDRIILNTAVQLSKRIRQMDDTYVDMLKQKISTLNERVHFSRMFVMITLLLGLANVINSVIVRYYPSFNVRAFWFSWTYLLSLFIPFCLLVITSHDPYSTFGLTTKNARKALLETAAIVAVFGPALCFLCGYTFTELFMHFLDPMAITYLVHSFIQEFIARGVIQTTISNFMFDKRNIISIFLASFYFGIFHLHIGFMAFLLTFIFGFIFGYIFYRHKNLIGVTLVHFILGWIVLHRLV